MLDLMQDVFVHHLRFEAQAREMASLGIQAGSALRGALYAALSRQFCPDRQAAHLPGHKVACPVCRLLAAEDPTGERGQDLPRPLTIEPPPGPRELATGECWRFGLSLIGQDALDAFPYLIRAVQSMGELGVNHGRFDLAGIAAYNPLTDEAVDLLNGRRVSPPVIPVTAALLQAHAERLPGDRVTLEFVAPLRIGEAKRLCHTPDLGVLLRRLIERCQAVVTHFTRNREIQDRGHWREVSLRLSEVAEQSQLIRDDTRWLDAQSWSRRTERASPIGGLVGLATWEGNLVEAIPWLLWGQSLHVGKSAVKGNGWYRFVKE